MGAITTKQVQDKDGKIVTVPFTTPCDAGVNGALPTLYTAEKIAAIEAQEAIDEAIWDADSVRRNAIAEIERLESEQTKRREREALLGIDNGWLATLEALIVTERAKL